MPSPSPRCSRPEARAMLRVVGTSLVLMLPGTAAAVDCGTDSEDRLLFPPTLKPDDARPDFCTSCDSTTLLRSPSPSSPPPPPPPVGAATSPGGIRFWCENAEAADSLERNCRQWRLPVPCCAVVSPTTAATPSVSCRATPKAATESRGPPSFKFGSGGGSIDDDDDGGGGGGGSLEEDGGSWCSMV